MPRRRQWSREREGVSASPRSSFRWAVRSALFAVLVAALTGCGEDASTGPPPQRRAIFEVLGDVFRTGVVGEELPDTIVVRLTYSDDGSPRVGASVHVLIVAGNGRLDFENGSAAGNGAGFQVTGPDGTSRFVYRIGTKTEFNEIRISTTVLVVGDSVINIGVEPDPGPVARIVRSGDGQIGMTATALPVPVAVVLHDRFGNPVPGVLVCWTVTSGAGSVGTDSLSTDAFGAAPSAWTLGPAPGEQSLTADVVGIGLFRFTALAQ